MNETLFKKFLRIVNIVIILIALYIVYIIITDVITNTNQVKKEYTYNNDILDTYALLASQEEIIKTQKQLIDELQDDITSAELQYAVNINAYEEDIDTLNEYYTNKIDDLKNWYGQLLSPDQMKLAEDYISQGMEVEYIGEFKCTAYCTEKRRHICGTGSGITASGLPVQAQHSVAINKGNLGWLPFGTKIYIEDVGLRYVEDTGPGVAVNQFDCAVGTHDEALRWSGAGAHRAWIIR